MALWARRWRGARRALLAVWAAGAACDRAVTAPSSEPALGLILPDSLTLILGDSAHLEVRVRTATGERAATAVRWGSRSPSIIAVTAEGRATAKVLGDVWLIVTADDVIDSLLGHAAMRWASVQAGNDVTCGLSVLRTAYCWGWNSYGALGTGDRTNATTPVPVGGGLHFDRVWVLGATVCGAIGATVQCWGWNGTAQIGDGTVLDRFLPVAGAGGDEWGDLADGAGATMCAYGLSSAAEPSPALEPHSAAATQVAEQISCWGWNLYGQLLDGTIVTRRMPQRLETGLALSRITAGGGHMCALDLDGAAWCWGRGDLDQAGDGDLARHLWPTQVPTDDRFVRIVAGREHTCALTTTGVTRCWGDNTRRQLGGGGAVFETITTSAYHVCGLRAGTAWCWGANEQGQIGNGANGTDVPAPVLVAGGLRFVTISAGRRHTCGLADDARVYCWGANDYGALGDGTTHDRGAPTRVRYQP